MSSILENFSTKQINTFGIDVKCRYYYKFNHIHQLVKLFSNQAVTDNFLVVGKGSNLLFTKDFDGLIIQCGLDDIIIKSNNSSEVIITASAGLEWDDFVEWCVNKGFWGIENLSYIPGTVGASPVQNIGAYGVEVSEFIERVTYFDPKSLTIKNILKKECNFGYRDSIFKNELSKVVVISVDFKLSKSPHRRLQYNDIEQYIQFNNIKQPLTIDAIRSAIISIRKRKLPSPDLIGNGGSFFKNPVVDNALFQEINKRWEDVPYFKLDSGQVKIPAAWLIDKSGWKGYRRGDAGVHSEQPLVLVNFGTASGAEILALSNEIHDSVKKMFGVTLEKEIIIL